MIDCYRILGVPRTASSGEIRAAYLAKMKRLHPDARPPTEAADAGEITFAYWQLRNADRRFEHDRALFGETVVLPSAPVREPPKPRPTAASRRRRQLRRSKRLQPLRRAAGAAACTIGILGVVLAFIYIEPPVGARPRAASLVESAGAAAMSAPRQRRALDTTLASAAAEEFDAIVRLSGPEGAHLYARQCLTELTTRPTMSLLDYCIAFDDQASRWEEERQALKPPGPNARRFFAEEQRFGRYASAAQALVPGTVRQAMMADVSYFNAAND